MICTRNIVRAEIYDAEFFREIEATFYVNASFESHTSLPLQAQLALVREAPLGRINQSLLRLWFVGLGRFREA